MAEDHETAEEEPVEGSLGHLTHDVRYLFAGIRGLLALGGRAPVDKLVHQVGAEINRYIEKRASDFQLSKPRPVGEEVVRDVLGELVALGILARADAGYSFTELGQELSGYLKGGETRALRDSLLDLMFTNYPEMTSFLRALDTAGSQGVIEIPIIGSDLLKGSAKGSADALSAILEKAIESGPNRLSISSTAIRREINERMQGRPTEWKAAKSAFEGILVRAIFDGTIQSRRKFDVIRARARFFGLANHGIFQRDDYRVEQVYLTSWLDHMAQLPGLPGSYREVRVPAGRLRIHVMDDIPPDVRAFENAIALAYRAVPQAQGFAAVADVRDVTCRSLRISEDAFSLLFEGLRRLKPALVKLDYSFDVFTGRRLPLRLPGDGGLYNLLKVTPEGN